MKNAMYLAAAFLVSAMPLSAEGYVSICEPEINEYCSAVEPGDGRMLACLYAHSATISDECYAATSVTGTLFESMFDRLSVAGEACSAEIQELCSEASAGTGELFSCLKTNQEQLSAGCAAGVLLLNSTFISY